MSLFSAIGERKQLKVLMAEPFCTVFFLRKKLYGSSCKTSYGKSPCEVYGSETVNRDNKQSSSLALALDVHVYTGRVYIA